MVDDIEGLIFDFDGLLMQTETTLLECWRTEWAHHGLRLDETTFFADHGGDTSEQHYADLAAAVGPAYDRAASHARRLAHRDLLHQTLDLAPGMRAWLDEAAGLGLPLAVASSSPRHWVHGHLNRRGELDRFAVRACGDEVTGHKPDPSVYLLALTRLGIPAARAVAFEDTPARRGRGEGGGAAVRGDPQPLHRPHPLRRRRPRPALGPGRSPRRRAAVRGVIGALPGLKRASIGCRDALPVRGGPRHVQHGRGRRPG
ncbi:HAD family hydrolase [Dactylosporangium darangshiense]|uniref:HAD family hydrolase n=1 Tax=Dactylosporangium darangshiense TaxID=579108 RepID=UPI003632DE6F